MWKQAESFKRRVKEYQSKTGKNQAEVAKDLGAKHSTLRFWLWNDERSPSLEYLQRAASVFGCSVLEFLDDPNTVPEGLDAPLEEWAGASEQDRMFLLQMFEGFKSLPEYLKYPVFQRFMMDISHTKMIQDQVEKKAKP